MRAMTGDYRKKMEEEKSKQYRLIQTGECIEAIERSERIGVVRVRLTDRFLQSQQKLHQLRSKKCQILPRSVSSTGELKPRKQPLRRTCNTLKPRTHNHRHHRLRRRQLLSLLHQRRSFASTFSDFFPEDTLHCTSCYVPG